MKSVKWKISILVLSSIIISSFAIGGASLFQSRRAVKEDSVQIMNLLCENRANDINEVFTKVEQSVSILHVFALRQMKDVTRFMQDPEYVQEYTESMLDAALNAALSTQGAITVYIRYDPSFTDPVSGFFSSVE